MAAPLQTVAFHGQELAVVPKNGKLFVAIKPICTNIGIDWPAQLKRIKRNDVLKSVACLIHTIAADSKTHELTCLPLDMLNGWLIGLDANRIKKPDVKARVIQYKRECYQVLSATQF